MILVTGATGNIGRELVDLLVARGQDVRALTRDPDRAGLPAPVEVVRGDPSDGGALSAALDGVDAVFLNVFGDAGPVRQALQSASPRRVVLLSTLSVATRTDLAEAQHHRHLEEQVRAVREDAVVLRPGQFMSNALWWTPMIAQGHVEAPFADVGNPMIDPADIAAVATEALLDDRHAGATLALTGRESPTPRERLGAISEVLGRPLTFASLTEEQFRESNPSIPPAALDYMVAMLGHPTPEELRTTDTVAEVTGRPPRAFRDWVVAHRDELVGAA
ncbi:NAD(P)H-binding protein [Actinomycetospora corticicola]|uniref:Uncharacterized protein YbjT (DUF2867 family) n=1 Tax=Actinomycetospora corticicola TaxID=663602 RepID=A0A7Y9J3V6_9PSEU|nr:NAD(P)H-binding protein [Actinomycetospora corticicola]NYD34478.1 uncharacterized protein YbjT (DUF2867 family) [Actinomycetospora corticicola]